MEINELNPDKWVDLFSDTNPLPKATPVIPGIPDAGVDLTADIIPPADAAPTTTIPPVAGKTLEPNLVPDEEPAEEGKPAKKEKPEFEISSYFEQRIKDGKFVALEEEIDGKVQTFIPKNAEEIDEFIETQVNYLVDKKTKGKENNWYQTKSPAWQVVAKYADMTDNPADVIPFIQGVQTLQSVADLDEKEVEGAEQIIRIRLQQRGDSQDIINDTIEDLKTTGKLETRAAQYKPIILQQEKQHLAQMMEERRQEEAQHLQTVNTIRENALKAIEAPLFGKKLKREEQSAIYELIAEPSEQSEGYQIYTEIDQLFEKGDFETLKQVALLLKKRDAFINYISTKAANNTAESLQRQLRIATDGRTTVGKNFTPSEENKPVAVQRNTFKKEGIRISGYKKD